MEQTTEKDLYKQANEPIEVEDVQDEAAIEEQLDNIIKNHYETFTKWFIRNELGVSPLQADKIYEAYYDRDDMQIYNPALLEIVAEIDWSPVYVTKELKHLLTTYKDDRDQMVATLQNFYRTPHVTVVSDATGFEKLSSRAQLHVKDLTTSNLDFFRVVNDNFQSMLTTDEFSQGAAYFYDLVEVSMRQDLIEEKEQFLRNYYELVKQELNEQITEKESAERSDRSPSLEI